MANQTIYDLDTAPTVIGTDYIPVWKTAAGLPRKVSVTNFLAGVLGTVVTVTGVQSIGGKKTFTSNLAIAPTDTSGDSLNVTRNLASASTDSPVANIVQDNTGDDQAALRVQQDGTGDLLQLFDGATKTFYVADGGVLTSEKRIDAVAFRTSTATIADDAVATYAPTGGAGILVIHCSSDSTVNAVIAFRAASTPFCTSLSVGSNVDLTTGALTGGAGTDGKFTISAHSDGNLYFSNRRGGSRGVTFLNLGG